MIDSLQMDAQRLSDARPPASIDQMWRDGVTAYGQTLSDLRTAASAGNETKAAVAAARASAHELQSLLGL
ncbi:MULTISPECIES: hypothetical protein [Microbacterium]|uniref:hypothetical protein n=1 Tax=Microbacterium TaxID=33882 RepID=UPI0025EECCC2|nr:MULTISPECIES: hypothetical protein [Microbacterium]